MIMRSTFLILFFAINSYNAIARPQIYDYDYESWKHPNGNHNSYPSIWNGDPQSHSQSEVIPPRKYRETETQTSSEDPYPGPGPAPEVPVVNNEIPMIDMPRYMMERQMKTSAIPKPVASKPMPQGEISEIMRTTENEMPKSYLNQNMNDMSRVPMLQLPMPMQMQMRMPMSRAQMQMTNNNNGMEKTQMQNFGYVQNRPNIMMMPERNENANVNAMEIADVSRNGNGNAVQNFKERATQPNMPTPRPRNGMTINQLTKKNPIPEFVAMPKETTTQTSKDMSMEDRISKSEKVKKKKSQAPKTRAEEMKKLEKKLEKMRDEMISNSKKSKLRKSERVQKEMAEVMKEIKEKEESSESESDEDDIIPVLRAIGLPDDFASGTTQKPKKLEAVESESESEEDEDNEEDSDDSNSDDDDEDSTLTTTTRRPRTLNQILGDVVTRTNSDNDRQKAKNQRGLSQKNAKTKAIKSTKSQKTNSKERPAGSGVSYLQTYNNPPYGPDNPGPGDVYIKDSRWKGLQKGSVTGQFLRMMLNGPAKGVSIMKPLLVGVMDTGGQTKEALGTAMETMAKELPELFRQAGLKTNYMFNKAGDLTGNVIYIKSGLVNTVAGVKNSLAGTLPLLFDGVGDMLGGLNGQAGQLLDFIGGLNDMISDGVVKAGRATGNLISGFVEGKKAQTTGALEGTKVGLNNEALPPYDAAPAVRYRQKVRRHHQRSNYYKK